MHTSQLTVSDYHQMLIKCQPSINWDVDQAVPIKMLTKGIDQQWITDAISTNHPNILQIFPIQNFYSSITKFTKYSKHWLIADVFFKYQ